MEYFHEAKRLTDLFCDLLGKQEVISLAALAVFSTCFNHFAACTGEIGFIYSNFDIKRKARGVCLAKAVSQVVTPEMVCKCV